MKLSLLLLFLLPILCLSQGKRPLSVRKAFDQGLELYAKGSSDEALKLFQQCVIDDPSFTEAHLNISYIYFEKKQYSEALSASKKALENNKFQGAIYAQIGKCMYHTEQYDSALYYLNQGVSYGAKSEQDYFYLGKLNAWKGAYRDAIFYFDQVIALNSNSAIVYNERGSAYFNLGEYELAKTDFEKAFELNPKSTGIYANLANVALALDDNDAAIEYINRGIAQADQSQKIQLLILKGNYYRGIGDLTSASMAYNEAYELDKENPIILNNQAYILIELEDYEGAFEKCNQALDLNPEMMEAYFNRGIVNEMLRNVEAACYDWEQAFILGSETAEEYLNSAICNE